MEETGEYALIVWVWRYDQDSSTCIGYTADNGYKTHNEAQLACIEFAKQIIDGEVKLQQKEVKTISRKNLADAEFLLREGSR